MTPKEDAAIITGTIASPSSPSVRFTALPAPTITKAAKGTKKIERLRMKSLTKGKVSDEENGACPFCMIVHEARPAMRNSRPSLILPDMPRWLCFVTFM